MSEKELLYIDDTLGHLENMSGYLKNSIDCLENENFKKVLEDLEQLNKDVYKKFYKIIGE